VNTGESLTLLVNGAPVSVPPGSTVAAAILSAGVWRFRRSVHGEPRSALCGMGICFECRVEINGRPHARSCQVLCEFGMDVRCDE
jgi:sarcosine oxidase subunit alpha